MVQMGIEEADMESQKAQKTGKRRSLATLIIYIFILIPFVIPLLMFLFWWLAPQQPMNIFLVDKSSMTDQYQEHRSVNWLLNYHKFTRNDHNYYRQDIDYFGFFPEADRQYRIHDIENYPDTKLDSLAEAYDMIYYADMYGIYHDIWYFQANVARRPNRPGDLLYGGMSEAELKLMKKMREYNKLIINEFNTFIEPTGKMIRDQWTEETGIVWSGWTGRYFTSLDSLQNDELPYWIVDSYRAENGGRWPFTKSGIVFLDNHQNVVVLEKGTHLGDEVPVIITGDYARAHYGLPREIQYPFWFNVVSADSTNQILAEFKIDVNPRGECTLKRHGIPLRFPAVVQNIEYPKFYYFAADFADNPIQRVALARFRGIRLFRKSFYNKKNPSERRDFFWEYYFPLMSKILNNYYREIAR